MTARRLASLTLLAGLALWAAALVVTSFFGVVLWFAQGRTGRAGRVGSVVLVAAIALSISVIVTDKVMAI